MTQPVSDVASNAEENIAHAAEVIGRSIHRRAVFSEIYNGQKRVKSVSDLMGKTGLSRIRVLDAGKKLADNRLCNAIKAGKETGYEKIGFYQQRKKQILRLASSKAKLKAFPTKRNVHATTQVIRVVTNRAKVKLVSIDDVDSFKKVRRIRSEEFLADRLTESAFKNGVQRVIGQAGVFKDWGGEIADLITTRLIVAGRRVAAAFAFKGPGTKGRLTIAKMGKNGDQIQRLLEAPAEVFFVQYCRDVDPAVLTQLKHVAMAKSQMAGGQAVRFGVIDGQDSMRLVLAYPTAFKSKAGKKK